MTLEFSPDRTESRYEKTNQSLALELD